VGSSQAPQVADLSERGGRCKAEVAAHMGFWEAASLQEKGMHVCHGMDI